MQDDLKNNLIAVALLVWSLLLLEQSWPWSGGRSVESYFLNIPRYVVFIGLFVSISRWMAKFIQTDLPTEIAAADAGRNAHASARQRQTALCSFLATCTLFLGLQTALSSGPLVVELFIVESVSLPSSSESGGISLAVQMSAVLIYWVLLYIVSRAVARMVLHRAGLTLAPSRLGP